VDKVIQHAEYKMDKNKNSSEKKHNSCDVPSNRHSKYKPKSLLETLLGGESKLDSSKSTSKNQKSYSSHSSDKSRIHLNYSELRDEMKQFIVAGWQNIIIFRFY